MKMGGRGGFDQNKWGKKKFKKRKKRKEEKAHPSPLDFRRPTKKRGNSSILNLGCGWGNGSMMKKKTPLPPAHPLK